MRLQIFLMAISSLFISFFVSFVICYIWAKITSMPSRKHSDLEDDKLAGAIYRAKVENLKKTPKLSTVYVTTTNREDGVETKSVIVKEIK